MRRLVAALGGETPKARFVEQVLFGETAANGLLCGVCGEPQFNTASGVVCSNGHGGVNGMSPETYAQLEHEGPPPPAIDVTNIVSMVLRKDDSLPPVVMRPDKERSEGVVHPSEAGGCLRKVALALGRWPKDREVFSPEMQRTFHVGHQTHHRLQGYLRRAAQLKIQEKLTGAAVVDFRENLLVKYPPLKVDGELDCAIRLDGLGWYVVELKSMGTARYKTVRRVLPEHEGQVDLYMVGSGARAAVVVIENRDNQHMQQFFVPYDRERMVRRAKGLKQAIAAAERKGPWPAMQRDYCYFCRYKESCAKAPDPR